MIYDDPLRPEFFCDHLLTCLPKFGVATVTRKAQDGCQAGEHNVFSHFWYNNGSYALETKHLGKAILEQRASCGPVQMIGWQPHDADPKRASSSSISTGSHAAYTD